MTESSSQPNSDQPSSEKPRVRIQRRRLGKIRFIDGEGKFGFIEGEDFRDDVYFRVSTWESEGREAGQRGVKPEVGMWVEFELDDEHLKETKLLRAKVVRPTSRPSGRKLSGRDATFQIVTHHPNARRKRPTWRK